MESSLKELLVSSSKTLNIWRDQAESAISVHFRSRDYDGSSGRVSGVPSHYYAMQTVQSTDWAAGSRDLSMMRLVNNFRACQQRWFTFPVIFQGPAVPLPREQSFRVGICCHTCPQLNTTARTKAWNINAPRLHACKLDFLAAVIRTECVKTTLLIYASWRHSYPCKYITVVKLIFSSYMSWIMCCLILSHTPASSVSMNRYLLFLKHCSPLFQHLFTLKPITIQVMDKNWDIIAAMESSIRSWQCSCNYSIQYLFSSRIWVPEWVRQRPKRTQKASLSGKKRHLCSPARCFTIALVQFHD